MHIRSITSAAYGQWDWVQLTIGSLLLSFFSLFQFTVCSQAKLPNMHAVQNRKYYLSHQTSRYQYQQSCWTKERWSRNMWPDHLTPRMFVPSDIMQGSRPKSKFRNVQPPHPASKDNMTKENHQNKIKSVNKTPFRPRTTWPRKIIGERSREQNLPHLHLTWWLFQLIEC